MMQHSENKQTTYNHIMLQKFKPKVPQFIMETIQKHVKFRKFFTLIEVQIKGDKNIYNLECTSPTLVGYIALNILSASMKGVRSIYRTP